MIRPLLVPLLTLALGLPPAFAESYQLPEIGDPASKVVSPHQEQELGEAFYRRLRQTVDFIDDPEVNGYLRSLGNRLAAHSDDPGQGFTFFMIKENSINAFAAPGGYIGTHSGLFLAAQRESELAAVLAHEIAHVTQRHLARAYDSASRMNLPTAAAILAAILISTQNSEAGQAALMSVQAGSIQQQINFTRSNEKEADRIGMHTLSEAHFDPEGMPDFFGRLQQHTRYYGDQAPPFLRTHPVTTDRIADAMARVDQMPHTATRESLNFYLMRAKVRVMSMEPDKAIRYFQDVGKDALPPAARDYGLALAYTQAGQADKAIALLQKLQQDEPDRIAYRIALAQAYAGNGQTDRALKAYRDALTLYPDNPVISQYYSRTLVHAGKYQAAYDSLSQQLRQESQPPPELYELQAKAASGLGHQAEAYESMGEYYYRNGQTHAAIEQYERALKQPGLNFYTTSRLEARLAALKKEALAERKE